MINKSKLPTPYLLTLILIITGILAYWTGVKDSQGMKVICISAGIATVLALATYYTTLWSLTKSYKKFVLTIALGTLIRMLVILFSIFIAFNMVKTYILSFIIALLLSYFLFLSAEIYVFFKMKHSKDNNKL